MPYIATQKWPASTPCGGRSVRAGDVIPSNLLANRDILMDMGWIAFQATDVQPAAAPVQEVTPVAEVPPAVPEPVVQPPAVEPEPVVEPAPAVEPEAVPEPAAEQPLTAQA